MLFPYLIVSLKYCFSEKCFLSTYVHMAHSLFMRVFAIQYGNRATLNYYVGRRITRYTQVHSTYVIIKNSMHLFWYTLIVHIEKRAMLSKWNCGKLSALEIYIYGCTYAMYVLRVFLPYLYNDLGKFIKGKIAIAVI